MNITVFGATGRTGRHVLTEGARRGHRITAFTRHPDTLTDTPDLTALVHGDGRDAAAVNQAIAVADAVIAIVAAATRKGPHHTAEVTQVIIDAMTRTGVRRLVTTSAYPIVADRPRIPVTLLRKMLAAAYADQAEADRRVLTSNLDATVTRLNRLLNTPARDNVHLSPNLLAKPRPITRADVAATLLNLAETTRYAGTAVNICGT